MKMCFKMNKMVLVGFKPQTQILTKVSSSIGTQNKIHNFSKSYDKIMSLNTFYQIKSIGKANNGSFYRPPFSFHSNHPFHFWLLFLCFFLFNFLNWWMPCSFSLCHRKRIINYEVKKFGRNKKKVVENRESTNRLIDFINFQFIIQTLSHLLISLKSASRMTSS